MCSVVRPTLLNETRAWQTWLGQDFSRVGSLRMFGGLVYIGNARTFLPLLSQAGNALHRARTPAGSRHEPRRQENTDHRKGEADLYDRADKKTDPGGNPSAAGATDVAVGGQLAKDGAGERPDDQPG